MFSRASHVEAYGQKFIRRPLPGSAPDTLQHNGLLWLLPSRERVGWTAANALCQQEVAGERTWRLPSRTELCAFFRGVRHAQAGWPDGFFWTLTLGANRSHLIVSSEDAEPYVQDNDRDRYHVVLVRRPQAHRWTLVD
jgi:hypothetical protein